jgi:hypothetical protein
MRSKGRRSIGSVLALLLAGSATAAPPPEPAALLAALRQPPPSHSAFFEQRESPLLAAPLQFRGELLRPAPGVLVKRIDAPYRELSRIADGKVVVERDDARPRRFSLRRAPELGALMASIEAVLAGDVALLQRHFRLRMEGSDARWTLHLAPLDKRLARRVVGLHFRGTRQELRCMDLVLVGSEISRTWLGTQAEAAAAAPDAAARDALCGPAG